jgi:ABC-2 type transport system permease protein
MDLHAVRALVRKDLKLYSRNRLFMYLTLAGLAMFIAVYFVMPNVVEDTYRIGIYGETVPPAFSRSPESGLQMERVASEAALRQAVLDGDYIAGVVLPPDIMERFAAGEPADITLYFTPDVPPEAREAVELAMRELAFMQTGQTLAVNLTGEVLGTDTLSQPVAPRDRMRPMLAVLILMMEMLALANLLGEETEQGTARALLVTPVTTTDLFIAKGITGTGLAFVQAVFFMIVVGGLGHQAGLIVFSLVLGAVFVTGIAFIVASVSRDFMSMLGWGMLAFIVATLPSFGVLFPGAVTGWVKAIPTYYLVDTVHRAVNFNAGWGDVWTNLAILAGCCAAAAWLGIFALRRHLA